MTITLVGRVSVSVAETNGDWEKEQVLSFPEETEKDLEKVHRRRPYYLTILAVSSLSPFTDGAASSEYWKESFVIEVDLLRC
jgi:hypothetical protein